MREKGISISFHPLLFIFFIILNVSCYWWAIYTAFPHYMLTHEASHYVKLQIPVGFLGALFDSLSFFVTIWIIKRALVSQKTYEYIFHLSLDLVIALFATMWVLFVFTVGGWIISLWENAPEVLSLRERNIQTVQYRQFKIQQVENIKNIYFGIIMGVSAALPTSLHIFMFFYSVFKKTAKAFFSSKKET